MHQNFQNRFKKRFLFPGHNASFCTGTLTTLRELINRLHVLSRSNHIQRRATIYHIAPNRQTLQAVFEISFVQLVS